MSRTGNNPAASTPAKAGVQVGNMHWLSAVRRYIDLSNWAPASAGVGIL
jgi:hypothetical protein